MPVDPVSLPSPRERARFIPVGAVNSVLAGHPLSHGLLLRWTLRATHQTIAANEVQSRPVGSGNDEVTCQLSLDIRATATAATVVSAYSMSLVPYLSRNAAIYCHTAEDDQHDWYSTEFKMIEGWRSAFQTPDLPFVYVEICRSAEEP